MHDSRKKNICGLLEYICRIWQLRIFFSSECFVFQFALLNVSSIFKSYKKAIVVLSSCCVHVSHFDIPLCNKSHIRAFFLFCSCCNFGRYTLFDIYIIFLTDCLFEFFIFLNHPVSFLQFFFTYIILCVDNFFSCFPYYIIYFYFVIFNFTTKFLFQKNCNE